MGLCSFPVGSRTAPAPPDGGSPGEVGPTGAAKPKQRTDTRQRSRQVGRHPLRPEGGPVSPVHRFAVTTVHGPAPATPRCPRSGHRGETSVVLGEQAQVGLVEDRRPPVRTDLYLDDPVDVLGVVLPGEHVPVHRTGFIPLFMELLGQFLGVLTLWQRDHDGARDRKSTRLNSSHVAISYAVFCLKKKNKTQ